MINLVHVLLKELINTKQSNNKLKLEDVIYSITFNNCHNAYIEETSRHKRSPEYKRAFTIQQMHCIGRSP